MHYFTDVIKKYFVFSGRASRKEFWMFTLWYILIILAYYAVVAAVLANSREDDLMKNTTIAMIPGMIITLGLFFPNLAVTVRRLHDVSKSGWLILINVIPIVGFIYLLILFITEGDAGQNEYGPDPYSVLSQPPVAPPSMSIAPEIPPGMLNASIGNVVVSQIEPISQSDIDKVIIKPDLPASEF